jgi:hypothetical protein
LFANIVLYEILISIKVTLNFAVNAAKTFTYILLLNVMWAMYLIVLDGMMTIELERNLKEGVIA